jgi:predicted short-subunit dehydrogenase-like oxidoreductase (DUF2520 family)
MEKHRSRRCSPCKPVDRGDWKSVDDYLPMLKLGDASAAAERDSRYGCHSAQLRESRADRNHARRFPACSMDRACCPIQRFG